MIITELILLKGNNLNLKLQITTSITKTTKFLDYASGGDINVI